MECYGLVDAPIQTNARAGAFYRETGDDAFVNLALNGAARCLLPSYDRTLPYSSAPLPNNPERQACRRSYAFGH